MEYNPIKTLTNEHNVISLVEEFIQSIYYLWDKNPEKYSSIVSDLILFLNEYSDKFHHRKEEEVLFPALLDCPDFILDDMISELETHHERFRDYTYRIQNDISKKDYPESYAILKEYCNDLLDHIAIENDELFVLAENILSNEELEKIYFKFEDIDREIGLERKVELEAIILNSDFEKAD